MFVETADIINNRDFESHPDIITSFLYDICDNIELDAFIAYIDFISIKYTDISRIVCISLNYAYRYIYDKSQHNIHSISLFFTRILLANNYFDIHTDIQNRLFSEFIYKNYHSSIMSHIEYLEPEYIFNYAIILDKYCIDQYTFVSILDLIIEIRPDIFKLNMLYMREFFYSIKNIGRVIELLFKKNIIYPLEYFNTDKDFSYEELISTYVNLNLPLTLSKKFLNKIFSKISNTHIIDQILKENILTCIEQNNVHNLIYQCKTFEILHIVWSNIMEVATQATIHIYDLHEYDMILSRKIECRLLKYLDWCCEKIDRGEILIDINSLILMIDYQEYLSLIDRIRNDSITMTNVEINDCALLHLFSQIKSDINYLTLMLELFICKKINFNVDTFITLVMYNTPFDTFIKFFDQYILLGFHVENIKLNFLSNDYFGKYLVFCDVIIDLMMQKYFIERELKYVLFRDAIDKIIWMISNNYDILYRTKKINITDEFMISLKNRNVREIVRLIDDARFR